MSTVVIKVETGFVGGTHEEDTGLTLEEWNVLTEHQRNQWVQDIINENISGYPVLMDDDGNETYID